MVNKGHLTIVETSLASWNLDVAPDGKHLAVIPRPEASCYQKGSVHVTVLLNFFDELRRQLLPCWPADGRARKTSRRTVQTNL
jgi:hypothetical protein